MEKSPKNKMIGSDDIENKTPGRTESNPNAEGKQRKTRYFFPTLQISIEADSQEEADKLAAEYVRKHFNNNEPKK